MMTQCSFINLTFSSELCWKKIAFLFFSYFHGIYSWYTISKLTPYRKIFSTIYNMPFPISIDSFMKHLSEGSLTNLKWISWHNANRYDFDILLMSNWKYHMDINTWGQYDVKNVSIIYPLSEKNCENKFWLKTNLAEISFLLINLMSICCWQLTS